MASGNSHNDFVADALEDVVAADISYWLRILTLLGGGVSAGGAGFVIHVVPAYFVVVSADLVPHGRNLPGLLQTPLWQGSECGALARSNTSI